MSITYHTDDSPTLHEIVELYNAVEWTAYTRDPKRLHSAISASLRVITARDGNRLIGLARAVGDGLTIVYLQDILVHPDYQNHGIGKELFTRVFAPYGQVRQKLLITDDEAGQQAFYSAMGFTEVGDLDYPIRVFTKFT